MANAEINEFLKLVPAVKRTPHRYVSSSYDADVLNINLKRPGRVTSEMADDDVIVRWGGEEVVGLIVLHASKR